MRPMSIILSVLFAAPVLALETPRKPATGPATQISETIRLRREVERLAVEVATLKEENARLRKTIVDAHLTTKASQEELDGFKITKGMRVAQITKMLGEPAEITRRDDDDFYVWKVYKMMPKPLTEKEIRRGGSGQALDPTLDAVGSSDPADFVKVVVRRVSASVRDGRVVDFTDSR
jgi:regulator of replication initiation timing